MTTTGRTLVLNKNLMPVNIIPVCRAIMKVCADRALFLNVETFQTYDFASWVVDWDDAVKAAKIESDCIINTVDFGLFKPEIIVSSEYGGTGYKAGNRVPKFSRTNLYRRDLNTCQYCHKKCKTEDLTMDHVIPKEQGGKATWENIVLACFSCNQRKRNRTPEQAGMRLFRIPKKPKPGDLRINPMERIRRKMDSKSPKTWEQF